MEETRKDWLVKLGVVASAITASLCCIVPVLVAVAGIGSAALATQLEVFRPYFMGLAAILLALAFYRVYRSNRTDCEDGRVCAVPAGRRRQRIIVWMISVLAVLLLAFPYYVGLIL